ncbi:MAG: sporulation transcriptional regulator SpoIIID [Eubacteriales bacterium]
MEERGKNLAIYIIENKTTVRKAAEYFGVSKSTVHTVISI